MAYDPRRLVAPASAKPIQRRRWLPWLVGLSILWPLAAAIAATATGGEPDVGLIGAAMINVCPAVGLSPFARAAVFTAAAMQGHDEFEQTALIAASARAFVLTAALILLLLGAAAWAGFDGHPVTLGPRLSLLWMVVLATLVSDLPVLLAERAIPLPADDQDEPR